MLFKAKLKHLRISPRKVRLVADLIKGLPIKQAEVQLKFLAKRSVEPILKLLKSAIANAQNNGNALKENLFVNNVIVDAGPTLKRWRPRAMGRAASIKKRTSHITLILEQKGSSVDVKNVKPKVIKEGEEDKTLLEDINKEPDKKEFSQKSHSDLLKPKDKFLNKQTFKNAKKVFRRKSF